MSFICCLRGYRYVIIFILLLSFLITGCQKFSYQPTITLQMPTASSSGTVFELGEQLSSLWSSQLSYITANAYASDGGAENLLLLQQGEANVTFSVTSTLYNSYHGLGEFEGNSNDKLRVIAGLYYNPNQIVISNENSINYLLELKGHNFSSGAEGSSSIRESTLHFQALGLNMSKYCNLVYADAIESIDLLKDNKITGTWVMSGVPNQAVAKMLTECNSRLISLGDMTINHILNAYPWYSKYVIPAGTYQNQEEDITTTAVKLVLCTTSDLDENTVYDLTKVFWKNIEALKESNSVLRSISMEGALTDIGNLPLHKGALKYYKEQGLK